VVLDGGCGLGRPVGRRREELGAHKEEVVKRLGKDPFDLVSRGHLQCKDNRDSLGACGIKPPPCELSGQRPGQPCGVCRRRRQDPKSCRRLLFYAVGRRPWFAAKIIRDQ